MENNACALCNKKLGLADTVTGKCKCGGVYCKKHRDGESHKCAHDYHGLQKELLKESLVVIQAKKVPAI
jgi:hypothetical protein